MKTVVFILSIMGILFYISPKSFADNEKYYVIWSCNESDKSLVIKTPIVSDDGLPPPHSLLLADVGRGPPPNRPIEVCNLGPRRTVKIRGLVNEDHPRNDHLEITIGQRPPIYASELNETITIRYKEENYFVSIYECDSKMLCSEKEYTNPSVECGPDKIDMLICSYDDLSILDAYLAIAWQKFLDKSKQSDPFRSQLIKEQSDWFSSRRFACGTPGRPGVPPDLIVHCLENLYKNRISQIDAEAHSTR